MVKNTIKVYGRVKRLHKNSYAQNYSIHKVRNYEEIIFNTDTSGDYGFYKNTKHRFRFCSIFEEHNTQAEVFDVIAKPVVDSVIEGYNGTIFAYGQTGSGKTYSMTGASSYESRGIIPRTIQYIFEYIKNSPTSLYNIYISYLEIYNEIGYDLLNPRQRASYLEDLPRVSLLDDAKGQTHLRNLSVTSVASEREAMCLLFLGDTNRTIAETPMNMYSSRSHCIFTVHVAATMTGDGRVRRSKLHLVDLAGSERIQKSEISGTLLVDAKQINLSLHYLEQVIIALSDKKRTHVPYRNSLMTSVLRDSLGGNCLTTMLSTLSVDPRNFEETISTCKFAQRVALVSSEAYINEEEDPELKISKLKLEIENLKRELILYKESNACNIQLQQTNKLTPEQINECEKQVADYLKSSSDSLPIGIETSKMPTYFKVFKRIIKSQMNMMNSDKSLDKRFTHIIKQKDNEISILGHLLSKEKLKTKETEKNGCFPPESYSELSTMHQTSNISEKKAFEIFWRNERNKSELNKCSTALEQKVALAKNIANKIKSCKTNIVSLKLKLRENINNTTDVSNKLMMELNGQQDVYRDNINNMRHLKTETDHLSHAFQQEKLRTIKRFKEWWSHENHKLEDSSLFINKTINSPSSDYEHQDMDVNLHQFTSQVKNNTSQFNIDTFPAVYDNEDLQQLEDFNILSNPNCIQRSISCQTIHDEYQFADSSTSCVHLNIDEYQTNPYLNQNQASCSEKIHKQPKYTNYKPESSEKYNSYYPETTSKQFTSKPQILQKNNDEIQYNIHKNKLNYHPYSENTQPTFMDDLPEKLDNSKLPKQFLDENNKSYHKYYPTEDQSVARKTETYCDNTNLSINTETIMIPETTRNQNKKEISQEFLESIPLTGDLEVDEEILAFYRAKRSIINNDNK